MTLLQWITDTAPTPQARLDALTELGGHVELDLCTTDPTKQYTHGWRGEPLPAGAVHTSDSYAHTCYWWQDGTIRKDFVN
jgi:hypothetical protein